MPNEYQFIEATKFPGNLSHKYHLIQMLSFYTRSLWWNTQLLSVQTHRMEVGGFCKEGYSASSFSKLYPPKLQAYLESRFHNP